MLGLYCCESFYLVAGSEGCSLVAVGGLTIVVASLVGEHRLWGAWTSVVGACANSLGIGASRSFWLLPAELGR